MSTYFSLEKTIKPFATFPSKISFYNISYNITIRHFIFNGNETEACSIQVKT